MEENALNHNSALISALVSALHLKILKTWLVIYQMKQYNKSSNICNGGKGVLNFVHQSTWFTGSQGPSGLGYGPPNAAVWLLWAGKAIIGGLLPMAIAQDVMSYASYQISGRWHIRCYITVYVMYRRYKSGCNSVLGSPFASPVAGDLSTPLPIEPP